MKKIKQNIFLTSMITMGFIGCGFAESFPGNGLMQENTTYTGAATEINMAGVYEGSVYANAQYINTVYQLAAGQYLPANSETPTTCDQNGYYCAGEPNGVNYQNYVQGLTQCPTGYANTANGASSEDDCYRACTVENANISHAATVSGKDYYGNGIDTCEPTSCSNGYHIGVIEQQGTPLINNISVDAIGTVGYAKTANQDTSMACTSMSYSIDSVSIYRGSCDYPEYANLNTNEWLVDFSSDGILYGHASCNTTNNAAYNIIRNNINSVINGSMSANEFLTLVANNADEVTTAKAKKIFNDFQNGNINLNQARELVFRDVALDKTQNFTPNNTGANCWCQITGYKGASNTVKQNIQSAWFFMYTSQDTESCAESCAETCSEIGTGNHERAAALNQLGTAVPMCEANTITINWDGASQAAINANNAGTATYDGDIRTPQSAEHVPGKRFTGWRFVAPTPVSCSAITTSDACNNASIDGHGCQWINNNCRNLY